MFREFETVEKVTNDGEIYPSMDSIYINLTHVVCAEPGFFHSKQKGDTPETVRGFDTMNLTLITGLKVTVTLASWQEAGK